MDNGDNQSHNGYGLCRNEIIRGNNAYKKVLENSVLISTDLLKAFLNLQSSKSDPINFTISPPDTFKVKVGFIIAKKKIRKAYLRNRIKRLLRETYRLNKKLFSKLPPGISLILSLTEKGYLHFSVNPKSKLNIIQKEMQDLQKKILRKFNHQ
ncbi:MAG: ribonuclease P protein component [bacterium]|nr:ribonuclease P protein component [bacterium]